MVSEQQSDGQELPAEGGLVAEVQQPSVVDLDNWFVAVREMPALDERIAEPVTECSSERAEPCFTLTPPPDVFVSCSGLIETLAKPS